MYEAKEQKQTICRKIVKSEKIKAEIVSKNKDEAGISNSVLSNNAVDIMLSFSKNGKNRERVLQKFAMANVVLDVNEEDDVYVANINFKERVPTNIHRGQGDHTVAEALIEASFKSIVPCFIPDFLFHLGEIIRSHLPQDTKAFHTSELDNKREQITAEDVFYEISNLIQIWDNINGFVLSRVLSDIATKVWRLLNQRPYSAFKRSEGITTGGGDERQALDELLMTTVPSSSWMSSDFIDEIAEVAIPLIDLSPGGPPEVIEEITRRAAEHIGDVLRIPSSDWKNRLGKAMFTKITGTPMKVKRAPDFGW